LWNDASKQTTSKAINLKKGVYKVVVKDLYGCSDSISGTVNEPLKVVTKIIATDSVNCFNGSDGSITTATTGGSNGYKYYWNDASKQTTSVAKSLKKGVYKMIIKDIYGCSDSLTGTVNEPAKVIVTLVSIDSVNCYNGDDGSIVMKYVGGNNGFKFIWEDFTRNTTTMTVDSKISKIKKGVYRLTASDIYGCYDTLSAKVNEPAKVTVNITSIDSVNCFQGSDGSITTNTTGGSNGYKFLWNDKNNQKTSKALGLKKGTYKLLVTDFYGCKDSVVGIVQEPIKVSIQVTQVDSGFCFGYSDGSVATITSGGTGSYKWRWNTIPVQTTSKAIGLKKGSYTVIVKDVYGCSDSATGIVNDPEQIVPKISLNRLTMKGLPHDLSAVITPNKKYKYDWKPTDVFYTVNTLSNPRVNFSETTKVELTVTDYKGCKGYDSVTIVVVQPLSEIIPTGFTPNLDNLNEGFGLPDIFEIQAFDVYNRWGEIVFRGGVSMPRWDGKINGDLAPTGTYSYTIQALLKGTDQIVKHGGSITLIR
jgi:gliding motility-associated-like protein